MRQTKSLPSESRHLQVIDSPEGSFAHRLQPTHQIAFPGAANITAVEFSPDGQVAYCAVDGQAVDLWALGLSRWPQALGGIFALLLLLYLIALARIRRRPQVKGDPYCARCNYRLPTRINGATEPQLSPRCPECGLEQSKRKPIKGRSTQRRLWLPTTILLLYVAAYLSLFATGLPRSAKAPDAPAIWSSWVDDYALRTNAPWLNKYKVAITRLMTVDTRSGSITGCLRTMRGLAAGLGMKVSPDGHFLAITESVTELSWIRADSGQRIAQTSGGSFMGSGMDEGYVLEIQATESDYQVYFKAVDRSAKTSRLLLWNPRSGQQRVLVEEPAFFDRYPHARRYALIRRDDDLATISAPDFSQAYNEKKFAIVVRATSPAQGGTGVVERTINVPDGGECCSSRLLTNADGSMLFVNDYRATNGYNANTGKSLGRLSAPAPYSFNSDAMLLHQGRLFMSVFPESFLVRDVRSQTWIAHLAIPQPFIAPDISISTDGRWLAATPFRRTSSPTGPYIHELFLYDLTPLNSPPPKPVPPR